jgi:hypothetical protein
VTAFRVAETRAQNDMNVIDGLGCERFTVLVTGREQFEVQPIEMFSPKAAELDVAETRVDVVLNDPAVPSECCRSKLVLAEREPLIGEVTAERDRRGLLGDLDRVLGVECRGDRFGVSTGSSGGVPASPFSAGKWIDAVVRNDVEAVVSFNDVSHSCPHRP